MVTLAVQWEDIFTIMSWIYSIAWCMSFYGQIMENYRLKSVEGMNLNFAAVNLNGFVFYALFNSYGYFVSNQQTGTIQLADLFFALHAFAATFYTAIQTLLYPKGTNTLSIPIIYFLTTQWIILLSYYLLTNYGVVKESESVGVVSLMGYYKLMCSLLKYVPQLLWNRRRKSTIGWSVASVLMDLTGGIFSVVETILEAIVITHFNFNPTKFLLGLLTIVYDLLFVYQHFVLYPRILPDLKAIESMNDSDSPSAIDIERSQLSD